MNFPRVRHALPQQTKGGIYQIGATAKFQVKLLCRRNKIPNGYQSPIALNMRCFSMDVNMLFPIGDNVRKSLACALYELKSLA